jgi:hypothetical protein
MLVSVELQQVVPSGPVKHRIFSQVENTIF